VRALKKETNELKDDLCVISKKHNAVIMRAHPLLSEENGRTVPAKIIMDAHNELTNFFKVTTLEDAPYTQKILADKYDPVEIQEAKSIMR
jgi:hypothetical protein